MATAYLDIAPTRAELDASRGTILLEFGANWCGICKSAQPAIAQALRAHPDVQHLKVADASGRPLGRSYGIKLWPTLIALREGKEVARLVRPTRADPIAQLLKQARSNNG